MIVLHFWFLRNFFTWNNCLTIVYFGMMVILRKINFDMIFCNIYSYSIFSIFVWSCDFLSFAFMIVVIRSCLLLTFEKKTYYQTLSWPKFIFMKCIDFFIFHVISFSKEIIQKNLTINECNINYTNYNLFYCLMFYSKALNVFTLSRGVDFYSSFSLRNADNFKRTISCTLSWSHFILYEDCVCIKVLRRNFFFLASN